MPIRWGSDRVSKGMVPDITTRTEPLRRSSPIRQLPSSRSGRWVIRQWVEVNLMAEIITIKRISARFHGKKIVRPRFQYGIGGLTAERALWLRGKHPDSANPLELDIPFGIGTSSIFFTKEERELWQSQLRNPRRPLPK